MPALCEEGIALCEMKTELCEERAALCENTGVLCEEKAALCEEGGVLCENVSALRKVDFNSCKVCCAGRLQRRRLNAASCLGARAAWRCRSREGRRLRGGAGPVVAWCRPCGR